MTRAADVGATYVGQLRERKLGWAVIARMTGAPEIDLRRMYGGLMLEEASEPTVDAVTAAGRVRRSLMAAGMAEADARIIARLWRANGGRLPASSLTQGLLTVTAGGGGDSDADRVRRVQAARRAAQAMGIEFLGVGRGTGLSVNGLAQLSEMAGLKVQRDMAA